MAFYAVLMFAIALALLWLIVWVADLYVAGKLRKPYGIESTRRDYIRAVRGLKLTKFERKVFKRGFYSKPRQRKGRK
jgi:hypothetical protein